MLFSFCLLVRLLQETVILILHFCFLFWGAWSSSSSLLSLQWFPWSSLQQSLLPWQCLHCQFCLHCHLRHQSASNTTKHEHHGYQKCQTLDLMKCNKAWVFAHQCAIAVDAFSTCQCCWTKMATTRRIHLEQQNILIFTHWCSILLLDTSFLLWSRHWCVMSVVVISNQNLTSFGGHLLHSCTFVPICCVF